jgi:signal transduction histidine kinase
MRNPLNSIVN